MHRVSAINEAGALWKKCMLGKVVKVLKYSYVGKQLA